MDAIEALMSRVSIPPKLLVEPAPEGESLDEIMETAMRAPDHGALQPWRFHIVRGDARVKLGELFAEALLKNDPNADAEAIEKERGRPLRSPLVIVAATKVSYEKSNVPKVEQIVATAAAVQNIMNAAHARGFGSFLATGKNARDAHVKAGFGLSEDDEIVGFVYFGTPLRGAGPKPRPESGVFVFDWG
jgi:nitroreductase